mmetsp:Transcript_5739/g.20589  ORF Transcript_5739/g.20589 Transcript_5739/m.20589 type:complete len:386 (-) Transcript_5739:502-1659(-)
MSPRKRSSMPRALARASLSRFASSSSSISSRCSSNTILRSCKTAFFTSRCFDAFVSIWRFNSAWWRFLASAASSSRRCNCSAIFFCSLTRRRMYALSRTFSRSAITSLDAICASSIANCSRFRSSAALRSASSRRRCARIHFSWSRFARASSSSAFLSLSFSCIARRRAVSRSNASLRAASAASRSATLRACSCIHLRALRSAAASARAMSPRRCAATLLASASSSRMMRPRSRRSSSFFRSSSCWRIQLRFICSPSWMTRSASSSRFCLISSICALSSAASSSALRLRSASRRACASASRRAMASASLCLIFSYLRSSISLRRFSSICAMRPCRASATASLLRMYFTLSCSPIVGASFLRTSAASTSAASPDAALAARRSSSIF